MSQTETKRPAGPIRRLYIARLVSRCVILLLCVILFFFCPQQFDILYGINFFRRFSLFHILWVIWVIDMLCQIFPIHHQLALGSQKHFLRHFRPALKQFNVHHMKDYIAATTRAAYKVLLLWAALIAVIGGLYFGGVLTRQMLLMISVVFYVCDLICVLIWCPFRLMMKTRCCTTCRIFNWDHLMMFSPLIFVGGFFSVSLVLLSIAVWAVWEGCIFFYPERFWEFSNAALTCANCTDKLCTQYCQKLKRHR